MAIPRFTTGQLLLCITWMCVGFAGIAFSLREWNLRLDPSYDWLAESEPVVSTFARVVGGTIVYWGVVLLFTPKPTADILIAAVVGVIPGLMAGLLLSHAFFSQDSRAQEWAAWIGMGLVPGVILICLAVFRKVRRSPGSP